MRAEDDASYVEFVQARQAHLRRVAYAVCGDWHRADDLLQTALVKLYVAWPRLHLDGREEAYVRRILVRADIDESRRPWRRERPGLAGHDPAARVGLGVEERSALFEALQRLPTMQRKVVLLRHWLGHVGGRDRRGAADRHRHREEPQLPRAARPGGRAGRATAA